MSNDLELDQKICPECKGSGEPTRKHSDLATVCEDCHGTGISKTENALKNLGEN